MKENPKAMGIPSGLQSAIISFSNVIVQSNINSFGANAMAGTSSYMKIDGFVILPIMSFGMANDIYGTEYRSREVRSGKERSASNAIDQ